jgi:hypothetical protein
LIEKCRIGAAWRNASSSQLFNVALHDINMQGSSGTARSTPFKEQLDMIKQGAVVATAIVGNVDQRAAVGDNQVSAAWHNASSRQLLDFALQGKQGEAAAAAAAAAAASRVVELTEDDEAGAAWGTAS